MTNSFLNKNLSNPKRITHIEISKNRASSRLKQKINLEYQRYLHLNLIQ